LEKLYPGGNYTSTKQSDVTRVFAAWGGLNKYRAANILYF